MLNTYPYSFILFCLPTLQKREVNTLLDDVIKHMTPERAFESHYPDLMAIVSRIVTHMKDYTVLFSMVSATVIIDIL